MSESALLEALEQLGVSALGQKIYLNLASKSSKTITDLISSLGKSRVTVYKNLDELLNLGVCIKDTRGNWIAAAPTLIFAKLKAKQGQLAKITNNLEQNLPTLNYFFGSKDKKSFAKIHTGRDEIRQLAAQFVTRLNQDYVGFGDSQVFEDFIGEEIDSFWIHERVKRQVKLRFLVQNKDMSDKCKLTDNTTFRDTRLLNGEFGIPGYFNIHGNTAYCWTAGDTRAIEISDEVFVLSLKAMFEMLWVMSS